MLYDCDIVPARGAKGAGIPFAGLERLAEPVVRRPPERHLLRHLRRRRAATRYASESAGVQGSVPPS